MKNTKNEKEKKKENSIKKFFKFSKDYSII